MRRSRERNGQWVAAVVAAGLVAVSAAAQDLSPLHPDESTVATLTERFSADRSLAALDAMRASLQSFRVLTEGVAATLAPEALAAVGHTGWEEQQLGFANWPTMVEGTIRWQAVEQRRLAWELAMAQARCGAASGAEVTAAQAAWAEAWAAFETFWRGARIAD